MTITDRGLDDGELPLETQIKRRQQADSCESDHDSHSTSERYTKKQGIEEHDANACRDKKGIIDGKKAGRLPVQRLGQNMLREQHMPQHEYGKELTANNEGELPDWKRLQKRSNLAAIDDDGNRCEKVIKDDSQHFPFLVVLWFGWTTRPIPG